MENHPLLSGHFILQADLMLFFFFLYTVAASTLARPTCGGAWLTTVFNALFLVALSHNGASTNRT